ncbi:hypothetical protein N7468_002123 [Penicillium chermesinum]|uniref:Glutathione S-transferase n=1 Tax=Penicillium chermesinum TaxID=63820 RepID=A0A9W9PI09_9EURO|nr:uncharacterized protein N7468_002123 [Penicillium chermesinum]KAJ5247140.1 hypothetical protein N7468_002123 [Penicillium chermesinum]
MSGHVKPLILHAHATGPNPIKVAIALESLKVPYIVKQWDFSDNPETGVKGSAFLKINENGRVPALEDPNTGVVSWESGASQDLVDFEKWEYFLLTTLGPMTGQTNWFRHYHPSPNEDALQRYTAQTLRCYDVLEGQLQKSGGASVLPNGVTAVDYHFEPWVRQHSFAGVSLDNHPLIRKWLALMGAREEVQEAYAKVKRGAGK